MSQSFPKSDADLQRLRISHETTDSTHRPDSLGNAASSSAAADDLDLDDLAEQFAEEIRHGGKPSIEAYAKRHAEFADEIRDLFPTILTMEKLNRRKQKETLAAKAKAELDIDQLGDYRVINEIARGGMGIVYEAEQVSLGRRVAVKVLPKQLLSSEKDIQRFQREALTAAKLHHTNIVPVFGTGEQDGHHYIVMQYIMGVGLDEILSELRSNVLREPSISISSDSSGSARSFHIKHNAAALLHSEIRRDSLQRSTTQSLSASMTASIAGSNGRSDGSTKTANQDNAPEESSRTSSSSSRPVTINANLNAEFWRNVAKIGLQAASALHYAHSHHTLHRDIKPGNLLLDDEGVVWVADFGLAKAVEQDNVTWTGDIVGTIGYMAPERFTGQTDERSDIYGLGLTLYELVTFQRAFEGRDRVSVMQKVTSHQLAAPRKRNPSIPKDLETIILKATAADPNDRYQSAEELADDLDAFLEDRPIKARRMPLTEQLVRWCRKNKAVAGLTAAVAALLIAISVSTSVGYMQQVEQRRQADEMRRQSDQFVDEAVNVLERIYGQFSPNATAMMSASSIEPDEDSGMFDSHDSMPISKDVAFVLENLLSFYDDLSQRSSDATSVLVKSVMANRRVGDIRYRLGDLSSARSAYERAIERFGSLPDETRSNPTMNVELARVYNGLGTVVRWNGERGKAIEAHETALQHLESVLKPDQSVRYEVAHTHFLLYHALHNPFQRRRGRAERDEAEAREQHLQLAIHQLEQLLASEPTSAESQFLLARCVAERGQQLRWRDWRQPEMNDFEKNAVDRLTQLMERFPHMPDYPFELANVYLQVFHSISRYGSPQRDEENKCVRCQEDLLKTALDVTKNLDRRHPNIPRFMHQQVDIQRHLGRVYAASGDWPKAETAYLAALDQARNFIDEFGDERGFPSARLHDIQLDRAQTLVALEDHDTAISILKSSIEFFEGRRETFSQNPYPDIRRWAEGRLKHAYPLLSTSLRATGDENGADEVLCKARNLR